MMPSHVDTALALLARPRTARVHLARNSSRLHHPGLCRLLIDRSHELRFSDAHEMVNVAVLAVEIATRCSIPPRELADLLSDAWCALANGLKVRGLLRASDKAFRRSATLEAEGTDRPVSRCVRLERFASLKIRQARFSEASCILSSVVHTRRQLGDPLPVAHALLTRAIAESEGGAHLQGLRLTTEAMTLVPVGNNPRLALLLRLHGINCLTDLGCPNDALCWLDRLRPLSSACDDPIIAIRIRWLTGKALAACGGERNDLAAEIEYRGGWEQAVGRGLPYEAAKIALELGVFYADRGRYQPLPSLVADAVPLFNALGLSRDAMASRLLARSATEFQAARRLLIEAGRHLDRSRRAA